MSEHDAEQVRRKLLEATFFPTMNSHSRTRRSFPATLPGVEICFKMKGAQNRRFAILNNPHFHCGSGQILDLGASCSQQSSKEVGGSRGRPGQILDLENGRD